MSANVEKVEHAVTETLNAMQLHEPCGVQNVLNELRQADPAHFRENAKLYEKMTSNYAGFPHLEISNIANAPDAPITCPASRGDCPDTRPHAPQRPAPYEAPPAPPSRPAPVQPEYVAPQPPPQPEYVAPPPPPQPEYIAPPPPTAPPPVAMPQAQFYPPPPGPDLGASLLGGLAVGLDVAAAVLAGRSWRHPGFDSYYRYNAINAFAIGVNNDFGINGLNTYQPYPIYPPPIYYPHQQRRRW